MSNKGRIWNDQKFEYEDPYSGRLVTRLTNYLGHTNHFYFTDPCWYPDNRSMLFNSDRDGQRNLFRYNFNDGVITQVTDLQGEGATPRACVCQATAKAYFWWERQIVELDLETLAERIIFTVPADKAPGDRTNPTADGRYVITKLDTPPKAGKPTISFAYSNFRKSFFDQPLTQIIRVDVATGAYEVLYEAECFMTHINTSLTLPDIMTFCHEGPWHLVEQRMWGMNIQTGDIWKIRPQDDGKDYAIGHEYWFADGERIGYHGRPRIDDKNADRPDGDHVFGHIRWDNTDHVEVNFPFHSGHFQSMDESIIVGDGTPAEAGNRWKGSQPFIQLFRWDGQQYVGPRILAYHRSTFNNQHAHPHPRFTPDGKYVLYSSDLTDYSNIYMVEVGDFEDLPLLTPNVPARPDML